MKHDSELRAAGTEPQISVVPVAARPCPSGGRAHKRTSVVSHTE